MKVLFAVSFADGELSSNVGRLRISTLKPGVKLPIIACDNKLKYFFQIYLLQVRLNSKVRVLGKIHF